MWIRTLCAITLLISTINAFAQNADPIAVANEYYYQGDYEKARAEFEKLIRNKRNIPACP